MIDTGSGVTHLAGAGCGSTCGLGLSEADGYNLSASSTGVVVGCGDECGCMQCQCDTLGSGEASCSYQLFYGESLLEGRLQILESWPYLC